MFDIPVKIAALEKRRRSNGPLHAVAGFFLVANADSARSVLTADPLLYLGPIFLVAALSIAYAFLRRKLDPLFKYNSGLRLLQSLLFLGIAVAMSNAGESGKSVGLFIWAVIAGMLFFSERVALQVPNISFDTPGISFPSGLTRKQFSWAELESVTLRSDFITVHLPENRFLQFEVREAITPAQLAELQDFCHEKLAAARVAV